jgi:hypothetical protein
MLDLPTQSQQDSITINGGGGVSKAGAISPEAQDMY